MVSDSAIVYEVESSAQAPLQVTPPPSPEDNSVTPTGEDQYVLGATANLGESGFQLMPAKFPYTPSGPPYIDNPDGGFMPANGALEPNNMEPSLDNGDTGNPSSWPLPALTTISEGGNPVPPKGPTSPALTGAQPLNNPGGNPGPKSSKSNDQLETLAKELAKM